MQRQCCPLPTTAIEARSGSLMSREPEEEQRQAAPCGPSTFFVNFIIHRCSTPNQPFDGWQLIDFVVPMQAPLLPSPSRCTPSPMTPLCPPCAPPSLDKRLTGADLFLASLHEGRRQLSLESWTGFEDALLLKIVKRAPRLEYLNFKGCIHLSDKTLRKAAKRLPELEFISVNGCARVKDAALKSLAHYCPSLRAVDVTYTESGDVGACALVLRCSALRTLSLMGTRITDTTVHVLAKNLERLESLNLAHCELISPDALRLCKLWRLHTLNLSACPVDDSTVRALGSSRAAGSLKKLLLADVENLTPAAIDVLVSAFPQMQSLDLTNARTAIDASAARKLYGSHIKKVNLFGTAYRSVDKTAEPLQPLQPHPPLSARRRTEANKEN